MRRNLDSPADKPKEKGHTTKSNKLGQKNCALKINHINVVLGEDSGHQQTFELRPTNPEVAFNVMQSSKFNDAERKKEERFQQQDSDGSGSVVSLQSSSSDDGKYSRIRGRDFHSEGAGLPMSEVDSAEEIGLQKEAGNKTNDDATRQNVGKLQQKLHVQPTQNTLDEIISTLKNQNGIKNPSSPGTSLPMHNDSTVGKKTFNGGLGWNSSPLQMR